MQPTGIVLVIVVEDHFGNIPVKFGQIPLSSLREEVISIFPNIFQCTILTPGAR